MTLSDLENAVAELPQTSSRVSARAWSTSRHRASMKKIERDVNAGKLDRATDEALADYRKGRAREL